MQTCINCTSATFPLISYKPSSTLLTNRPAFLKRVETIRTLVTRQTQTSASLSTVAAVPAERTSVSVDDASLRRDRMPEHLAVILDGNRRWFKTRGLELDYEPFLKSNLLVADLCIKWGIGTTTCFIYALENMRRNEATNELMFRQFEKFLVENFDYFVRKNMKVTVIGESSMYPQSLKDIIKQVEEATIGFSKLELTFAVCYGGTRDVTHAVRSICTNVKDGRVEIDDVNEDMVEQELYTKHSRAPKVDLLIRTGGHLRLSNYLMWQMAEAEMYFTTSETMAPNFGEHVFIDALRSYQNRERTLGK